VCLRGASQSQLLRRATLKFPKIYRDLHSGAMSAFRQFARTLHTKRARVPAPESRWLTDHRGEEIRTAKARRLGISTSPRKLNLVAKLVRGLTIEEARRQLTGCRKKHSEVVMKTIDAAVTNARAFSLREDRLVVNEAFVGKGKYLVRIRPWHGKGRYGVEHKKYSHLTVTVRELDDELWEARVLPQYVHMHFSRQERLPDLERNHPIHQSDRVSFSSQLDQSLRKTHEGIAGLKALLQTKGSGAQKAGVRLQTSK